MDTALHAKILDILDRWPDMTVATVRSDGAPQATVVSFVHDGLRIYFGTGAQAQKAANIAREPRVSISRSIFALMDDRDRVYFGRGESEDQFGYIEPQKRAVFGRSYAAEPDVLVEQLRGDEAIAEADTLLLTVPNQLGVDYNAHVIEAILTHVAPGLGWR